MLQCNGLRQKIPSFGIFWYLYWSIQMIVTVWFSSDDRAKNQKTGFAFYTAMAGFSKSFA